MQCNECKQKLELYIDNELPENEQQQVEAHILNCRICAQELEDLKSIQTFGKLNTFTEPEPEYWNELTQNIKNKISKVSVRTEETSSFFEKVRSFIWPESIGYRIISLAAAAVIIFFVVRISLLNNGKLELTKEFPMEHVVQVTSAESDFQEEKRKQRVPDSKSIDKEEIEINDPSRSTQSKDGVGTEDFLKGRVHAKKRGPKKIGHDKQKLMKSSPDIDKKDELTFEGKAVQPAPLAEKSSVVIDAELNEADNVLEDNVGISINSKINEQRIASKKIDSSSLTFKARSSMPSYNPKKNNKLSEQKIVNKQVGVLAIKASRSSGYYEALSEYNNTYDEIQTVKNDSEKVKMWDSYLKIKAEQEFQANAKFQQAILFNKIANKNKNIAEVEQAINFYEKNIEILKTCKEFEKLKLDLDKLKQFLEELKKDKK